MRQLAVLVLSALLTHNALGFMPAASARLRGRDLARAPQVRSPITMVTTRSQLKKRLQAKQEQLEAEKATLAKLEAEAASLAAELKATPSFTMPTLPSFSLPKGGSTPSAALAGVEFVSFAVLGGLGLVALRVKGELDKAERAAQERKAAREAAALRQSPLAPIGFTALTSGATLALSVGFSLLLAKATSGGA